MDFNAETLKAIATIIASAATSITGVFLIAPRVAVLRSKANAENSKTLKEAIDSMNQQINLLDERLVATSRKLMERDVIIDSMSKKQIEMNSQIVDLNKAVASRDATIERLKGANDELNRQYKKTSDMLTANIETIQVMEAKLALAEDWKMGVEILTSQVHDLHEIPRYRPK